MVVLPQQEEAASVESKGVHVIGSRIYDPGTYRWWQLEPTGGVSSTAISRDDLGRGLV